jgi:hypothetical protein
MPAKVLLACFILLAGLCPRAQETFREIIIDPEYLTNPWSKAMGDLNGDGFKDFVVGTAYNRQIYWYEGPSWTRHVVCNTNGGEDLVPVDMDGDGDLDLISNGYGIWWHVNPTAEGGDPRAPWQVVSVWFGGRSHDLMAGDIDQDGRMDVAIRREFGVTKVFLQQKPRVFTQVDVPLAPGGTGSALADINRDNRPDIVENGFWMECPADPAKGTWLRHDFAAWDSASAVAVYDINRDGRADVFLSLVFKTGHFSWFEAPPDPTQGNWTEHVIGNPVGFVHRFHLADLDRDGYRDVIFAEQHDSPDRRVGVFHNADTRGGAWQLQVISTTGSHNMVVGDVGSDGDLDLFGVNWRVDTRPRLWENLSFDTVRPPDPPAGDPPPPAPTGLMAVPGDAKATLSWAPAARAKTYALYWREGQTVDKTGQHIGGVTSPYILDRLANGVTHAFAVSAANDSGESPLSAVITAVPRAPSARSPFGGTPWTLPGVLQTENFDDGGEGIAYHDLDTANQGGRYRATGVDVNVASDSAGGYYVGWIGTGEWLEYTVRVARSGAYRMEARLASPLRERGFHVLWNGRDVSGPVRAPFTDGWQKWTTFAKDITLPDSGLGTLRVYVDTEGFNCNWLRFTALGAPPDSSPAPGPGQGAGDSLEAEAAFLSGPIIGSDEAGFLGTGFVDYQNPSNDFLEWTATVPEAGTYELEIRYANADTRSRPLEISVNGAVSHAGLPFPPTGSWGAWSVSKAALTLPKGQVRIRARAVGLSGPNVDRLKLTR